MSYAAWVSDGSGHATNALRFAQAWEADCYARELHSRWMAMRSDWQIRESADPVNYYWDAAAYSAREIPGPDRRTGDTAAYDHEINRREIAWSNALLAVGMWWTRYADSITPPSFVKSIWRVVQVDALPEHAKQALRRAGYFLRTVDIEIGHEKICVSSHTSDGQRAIVVTTARDGEAHRVILETGSFGGPNIHERSSLDECPVRAIPVGGVIVVGHTARIGRSPRVVVHARAVDALAWLAPDDPALPVARDAIEASGDDRDVEAWTIAYSALGALATESLTPVMRLVLHVYRGIKSGARPDALARVALAGEVSIARECLIARGLLARASNGATRITPAGKDAIAGQSMPLGL